MITYFFVISLLELPLHGQGNSQSDSGESERSSLFSHFPIKGEDHRHPVSSSHQGRSQAMDDLRQITGLGKRVSFRGRH